MTIDRYEDIIDSREIEERISEIELEATGRWEAEYDPNGEGVSYGELADVDHYAYLDDEDAEELRSLRALALEGASVSEDWTYGATLVRDSYFVTYAQEFADDIGAVPDDLSWPASCIDWDKAAWELRMDYSSVDFDGVTYWVR
jgi:hypothetical protein